MKFTEHLSAHVTPEWRTRYMNYEEIKTMIKQCAGNISNFGSGNYIATCETKLFSFCGDELAKVDTFFVEKLSEVKRKFVEIKRVLNAEKKISGKIGKKQISKFRFDLSEFYLSLILLQNFQKLNYTGFRNVLRYHDKILRSNHGEKWLQNNVHKSSIFTNNDINNLIKEIEELYINELEDGDRKRAMDRLRVPSFKEEFRPWAIFRIGFLLGGFTLLISCEIVVYIQTHLRLNWYNAIPLYRGTFSIILVLFFWSINMYTYRTFGINQILIFEVDPRNHISINDLMELVAVFAAMWAISLLLFIYHSYLYIPMYLPPIMLYLFFALFIFNPTKTILYSSRLWALEKMQRLCLAPLYFVMFPDFWIGDQLTSVKLLLLDLKFTFCFLMENPKMIEISEDDLTCHDRKSYANMIIEILPSWFRFAQVIRRYRDTGSSNHLINAGKFFTTIITIITIYSFRRAHDDSANAEYNNPLYLYIIMIILLLINCIYNLMWDFKIDWSVFQIWKGKKIFLRDQMTYPQEAYYIAIIENIIIRFHFVVPLIFHSNSKAVNVGLITAMGLLDIFRRFIWNFFRLENEHINNCGKFRVHRDISVRPREAALFTDDKMNEEFIRNELMDEILERSLQEAMQPELRHRMTLFRGMPIRANHSPQELSRSRNVSLKNVHDRTAMPGRATLMPGTMFFSAEPTPRRKTVKYDLDSRNSTSSTASKMGAVSNKKTDDLLILENDSEEDSEA